MRYKQPCSIQVVIFAESLAGREYLLLKRVAGFGGYWQSVTGSLEEGETHAAAAVREVFEETGIAATEAELIDLSLVNTFEIAPQWRVKYAPGVTHNEEVCFGLKVGKCEVRVDPLEHDEYAWADYQTALGMLHWDSSKRAFAALNKILG